MTNPTPPQGQADRAETAAAPSRAAMLASAWHNYAGNDSAIDTMFAQGFHAALASRAEPPQPQGALTDEPIVWQKSRSVKSRTDMHPTDALQVGLDNDNDVMVSLWTSEAGYASVEFCNPGGGGGKYPNTRKALIALMVAMEADALASSTKEQTK